MFCHHCGARLPDGAKFCTSCGMRVEPEAPAAPSIPVEPSAPVEPIDPIEPAAPVEPVEPIEPAAPVEPVEPVEPAAPVEPIDPVEPVAPVEPIDPVEQAPAETAPQWAGTAAPADTAVAQAVHTTVDAPAQDGKAPKAKAKGNAGRIVLSIFLSILLCVSLLASTLVTVLKFTVTPERLATIVTDLVKNPGLLSSFNTGSARADRTAAETKAHKAASLGVAVEGQHTASLLASPRDTDDTGDIEDLDDLADYLYDMAKDEPGWENTSKQKIRDALDSSVAEDFLNQVAGDLAEDYTSVLLEGKKSDGKDLTEKLTEYVMEHEDEVKDVVREAGFTGELDLNERKLEKAIRENMPEEIATLSPEKIAEENKELVDAVQLVFSPLMFIGLWAITALLLVLLIVVNRHRFSAVLYCVGIPALILGLIFLAGYCTMEFYPAMKELPLSLIPTYMGKTVLLTGAGLTGCGVLLIVIKLIVRAVRKKRA